MDAGNALFVTLNQRKTFPMRDFNKALEAYGKALEMSQLGPEKRFLRRRIQEVKK
jgi:hypothetical protein